MHASDRYRAQATIELALIVPGLLLGLFLITAVGLVARADGEVAGLAVEAARAGVLVSTAGDVEQAATDRAAAVASAYGMTLKRLDIAVDSSQFHRGGSVRVTQCRSGEANLSSGRILRQSALCLSVQGEMPRVM